MRQFPRVRSASALCGVLALMAGLGASASVIADSPPVAVGSRLELFVDQTLLSGLEGSAKLEVQRPQPQEVVLVTGEPWEGNTCAYYTILQDGDTFRMYYRGSHYDELKQAGTHPEVVCYAESRDGIHWVKPELGLCEFGGSTANNIIWNGIGTHNFTPFVDANPNCAPEARLKALGRAERGRTHGLYAFQSADGIHWSLMSEQPVITEGVFDSQNLAFWDPVAGLYRDYHRGFRNKIRDIMTCTSTDFLHWTKPVYLEYPEAPVQHLYTNAIRPYDRAPHILIGFPTRYLPQEGQRVEPVFMSSRDGHTFRRFDTEVISQDAPADRKGNRSNYMANGVVSLPGKDGELSVYATEAYYTGPDSRLRRFTYRRDGFVALTADGEGGAATTVPVSFTGKELLLNYQTRKGGLLLVELQDAAGKPLPGFTAEDCTPLTGGHLAGPVTWKGGDVASLAGKPVRLRFLLKGAKLYSWQFR